MYLVDTTKKKCSYNASGEMIFGKRVPTMNLIIDKHIYSMSQSYNCKPSQWKV